MIEVKEVKTKQQQKEFLEFPLRLYRDNPYYVPPLFMEEKKLFDPEFVQYETSEAVFFNAYVNGKIAGRIAGILHKAANEKQGRKRVRFSRFDVINNKKVARALFDAVEKWAKEKGMDTVCGPLGFSGQDREGILIEGFRELSSFHEQYNADYYQDLVESCGYSKEADWVESKIYLPEDKGDSLQRMSDFIMKRYNLRFGEAGSVDEFLEKYAEPFLELLDQGCSELYGYTPQTKRQREEMLKSFRPLIRPDYCDVALDETGKVVAVGLCFPSISEAVQKSYGHLTPAAVSRISRAVKHPRIVDMAFIAVAPEYLDKGVNAVVAARLAGILREDGVEYGETLLNPENNKAILQRWKRFNAVQHKRRRAYIKEL